MGDVNKITHAAPKSFRIFCQQFRDSPISHISGKNFARKMRYGPRTGAQSDRKLWAQIRRLAAEDSLHRVSSCLCLENKGQLPRRSFLKRSFSGGDNRFVASFVCRSLQVFHSLRQPMPTSRLKANSSTVQGRTSRRSPSTTACLQFSGIGLASKFISLLLKEVAVTRIPPLFFIPCTGVSTMPSYDKPNCSQHFNGSLDDQIAQDLHITGKAHRAVYGNLRAVSKPADSCQKSPDPISETQLRRYFLHVKNQRKATYRTRRLRAKLPRRLSEVSGYGLWLVSRSSS